MSSDGGLLGDAAMHELKSRFAQLSDSIADLNACAEQGTLPSETESLQLNLSTILRYLSTFQYHFFCMLSAVREGRETWQQEMAEAVASAYREGQKLMNDAQGKSAALFKAEVERIQNQVTSHSNTY